MLASQWEEFLDPSVMRPRLITAAVYIASFELLKERLIGRIKEFLSPVGLDGVDYENDVLKRNKSPLYASFDWLREMGAIDDSDVASFEQIKGCRNRLAHELMSLIGSDGLPSEVPDLYDEMIALLRKVETWWIQNVDLPTNPDYDGQTVEDHEIIPGPVMGLQLLRDVALGSEQESRKHLKTFWELQNRRDV